MPRRIAIERSQLASVSVGLTTRTRFSIDRSNYVQKCLSIPRRLRWPDAVDPLERRHGRRSQFGELVEGAITRHHVWRYAIATSELESPCPQRLEQRRVRRID
jgi:hypothetical protein